MEDHLEISGLTKRYDGFTLNGVSFRVPKGYIMGLIGPNGAGKTTIIKPILNLVNRDGGTIKVFGSEILDHEIAIKERIGFVLDVPAFHEHLTLSRMAGIIAPFYRRWDERLFRKLAGEFGLDLTKKIKALSKGMKTKYALALALSHDAELIIVDEPTSGLDPVFRRELLGILSELLQDGNRSILFSTHITTDLDRIADYITFVHKGEIVFSAAKDEIVEHWGIVKGGNELLTPETMAGLLGYRKREFGFEGLTARKAEARRLFGTDVVVEKATLEDIMYYVCRGEVHA